MDEYHNGLSLKTKQYLHSYLPQAILDRIKHIEIIINELSPSEGYHTFRNAYILGKISGDTYVYNVCSPLGIKQVALAIDIAVKESLFNPTVHVQPMNGDIYDYPFDALRNDLCNIQEYINCSDKVLFARSESVKDWFIREKLKELNLDSSTIDDIFIEKEMIRLSPTEEHRNIFKKYLDISRYDNLFQTIPKETVVIGRLSGFNITYKGHIFAIIDRPWGRDMAHIFAKEIMNSRPSAIGIIGGCGSLSESYPIESTINPSKVYSPECGLVSLNNLLGNTENITIFNIDSPFLETHGVLQDLIKRGMHAIEMELAGFRKGIPKEMAISCSLYVMDTPINGFTLNETYYDAVFLRNLFAKKNRAKDEATRQVITATIQ